MPLNGGKIAQRAYQKFCVKGKSSFERNPFNAKFYSELWIYRGSGLPGLPLGSTGSLGGGVFRSGYPDPLHEQIKGTRSPRNPAFRGHLVKGGIFCMLR
jgi:hypothetical protein